MTRVRGASFTALVLVALGATAGLAPRAGDLDPAFGNGSRVGADEDFVVVRYHANGALDRGFGTSGYAVADFAAHYDFARTVLVQPDGRIVVGGSSAADT